MEIRHTGSTRIYLKTSLVLTGTQIVQIRPQTSSNKHKVTVFQMQISSLSQVALKDDGNPDKEPTQNSKILHNNNYRNKPKWSNSEFDLPKGVTRRGTRGGENGGGQNFAIRSTHDLKRGTHVTNEAHRIGDLWLEGDLGRGRQIGVWRRLRWFGVEAGFSDGVSGWGFGFSGGGGEVGLEKK